MNNKHEKFSDQLFLEFSNTFSNVLTDEQLKIRIEFLIANFNSIDKEKLMKTILYCLCNNKISRYAVDFKLGFVSENYAEYITNATSYEIDNFVCRECTNEENCINYKNPGCNKCFVHTCSLQLKKYIADLSVAVNNWIFEMFINDNYISLNNIFELHSDLLHFNILEDSKLRIAQLNNKSFNLTGNQIGYLSIYKSIYGETVDEKYLSILKTIEPIKHHLFKILHEKRKTIEPIFVEDQQIFG